MTTHDALGPVAGPVHLLLREVWSRGDLGLVDELVAETYVQQDPALPEPITGPDALATAVERYRRGVPDLTKAVETTVADGGTVAVTYRATGTHEGELLGLAPTGRAVAVDGVLVARVDDGVLVDGTDMWDVYGLLRQLGGLSEPLAD